MSCLILLTKQKMMYDDAKELGRHAFIEKYGAHSEWIYDKVQGEFIREILKESLARIDKQNERDKLMGRIKDWLIDMEEDATVLPRDEWVQKHGQSREHIFDKVQGELAEVQGELNLTKN